MSGSDENFANCGRNDAPVLLPAPALVAPGVLPVTDALMAKRQIGLRRWVVDAEMAHDVDEEFSPDKVDLAGEIIYQSVRMVALHQFNFDPVMCATYVGLHKSRLMLSHVVDPNEGQAVSWHDEQMAQLNKGERAISLLCYARKFGIAVWSIYSRQESRRIYFVMLTSELEYEYSNNFPVEESVEQKQMSRKPSERSSDLLASFVEQIASGNMKERDRERERERVEATTTESPEATESPPTEDPTQEQGALPNGEQVTPKPSESSPPPLKEPTNDLLEATEALNKRRRDAGRIVMAGGACPIKGSLFLFPARKSRKEAVPLASDVVAPASDEEVQMTKKPSESSKESSKSSDPPPKEPTNYLLEATEALNKQLRDSGTTVTEGGARKITGSLFVFPGRKVRKKAAPPASDVVAPASDEEV